uniref:T9SS type A sorting domain-containing protein n=1 Tax=candidate division WOR-3 bacterium TaxID=2052148 RepID=A0A7C4XL64_UNCW3
MSVVLRHSRLKGDGERGKENEKQRDGVKKIKDKKEKNPHSISLYNTFGQKVREYSINPQGKDCFGLDVEGLASGIYFIDNEDRKFMNPIKVVVIE